MASKKINYPTLFQADKDWTNNACLNFVSDPTHGYIEGYKKAADFLVSHVMATGRDQDYLVCPIVFLYRQHIELQLKEIISGGQELLDEGSSHPTHPKIHALWQTAKGIIRKIWSKAPDPPEFEEVGHFLAEFAVVDPGSTAFRYPKEKDGRNALQGLQHINLRHLSECIQSVSEFFDGVIVGIGYELNLRNEMLGDPY